MFTGKVFILFLMFSIPLSWAKDSLCPTVEIRGGEEFEFTPTEKRLLCGDKKLEPWENIPSYQAKVFMQGFLQSRGYLNPRFELKGKTLVVHPGELTLVEEILVSPQDLIESSIIETEIWRLYDGRPITPKLLDAMEADALKLLRERAYACVKTRSIVDGVNGIVIINLESLKRYKFGEVDKEEVKGVQARALERFYPFDRQDAFDSSLLELTEKRIARAGVAQSSYFVENCDELQNQLSLSHKFILGPRKVFRFGVGASTEVGPMIRVRWSNNRSGPMASQYNANLQSSFRTQSLSVSADNFLWPEKPRRSLKSEFEVVRESQVDYEETNTKLRSHGKWTGDYFSRFWRWTLGPTLMTGNFITDTESEESSFRALGFEGGLDSMAHQYELFDFHPEQGSLFQFHFDYRHPNFGFHEELLKLDFAHVTVGRLWRWGRGDAVGGIRLNAHTTVVNNDTLLGELPPSVKFYGGGSDDIRGFSLRSLPENNGLGSLTKLSSKFELRKTHFFRPSLELFGFFDVGLFGFESWSLERRVWQAPGAGLRWLSPVGMVQGFVSKGFSTRPYDDHGALYYLGLGGEF